MIKMKVCDPHIEINKVIDDLRQDANKMYFDFKSFLKLWDMINKH